VGPTLGSAYKHESPPRLLHYPLRTLDAGLGRITVFHLVGAALEKSLYPDTYLYCIHNIRVHTSIGIPETGRGGIRICDCYRISCRSLYAALCCLSSDSDQRPADKNQMDHIRACDDSFCGPVDSNVGDTMEKDKTKDLQELKNLVDAGQISPESFLAIIKEMITTGDEQITTIDNSDEIQPVDSDVPGDSGNNLPQVFSAGTSMNHDAVDRQSLSVQIKQIDGSKTTIRDEKISHTENGGLHSAVDQAIIQSCEGRIIDTRSAQGVCEITGKLAQKTMSCYLCHRSICLKHCEFIEHNGENYPFCNTPFPGSKISCAKRFYLSMNTWQKTKKKLDKEKTDDDTG